MRKLIAYLVVVLGGMPLARAADAPPDPRADVHFANPGLRALMDWVSFQLTFDGDSLTPDMAAGDFKFTPTKTPRFVEGLKGRALVAGDGSGYAIYPRERNAPLATRGAISLWVCPVTWTHVNGGNTVLLMTTNASFYLQRQGPLHDPDGGLVRAEGVQFLMLAKTTGNNCLMFGTEDWPLHKWRLLVANWSWPMMQFSLDGGEFQSLTLKQNPAEADFGGFLVGSDGGEETLLDEVTIYRRPLSLQEVQTIYEALRPKQTEAKR